MSKYKCIIFDCDGVLVDSEVIGNTVMVEMANELGADINLDYAMRHFKGNSLENCFNQIKALAKEELLSDDFATEYRRRSYEAFKTDIEPIQGVKEVIQNLKVDFCVASSGPVNKIELNLELTGLLPYFKDKIFSCYTINKWKPDPAVFQWAAETMGYRRNECLVIEDSLIGVNAAINGGFDVYGYTEHDYKKELHTKANKVFNSMNELLDLL